jgi:superfamily II DNA helicase RecQ
MIEESAPGEQKRVERQKLESMLAYCESARCRRVILLNYFGEQATPCGNCDVCLDPPLVWDGTVAAQKACRRPCAPASAFGAGHLIDILRGKSTEKVRQFGHDRLPTFGVGADIDDMGWRSVFRQLLAAGLLDADASAYGALKLTDSARPILKGETSLQLRRRVERPKRSREARSKAPSMRRQAAPSQRFAAAGQAARVASERSARAGGSRLRHPARSDAGRDRRAASRFTQALLCRAGNRSCQGAALRRCLAGPRRGALDLRRLAGRRSWG